MEYKKATLEDAQSICALVQRTIKTIYPKYYPAEVVTFFCELHSFENIKADIASGCVGKLVDHDKLLGTGSYHEQHITRVYVDPDAQKKGYGGYIIRKLEAIIKETYDCVHLDASLPACCVYEHMGYHTRKHDIHLLKHDVVLVYEIMEKDLSA